MARLGPFEERPDVAIACSGGPDSMALVGLADSWAKSKGGSATALIVDHGLRPESDVEARTVFERLSAINIQAVVLERRGPRICSDIQARARDARYELLTQWCAERGVLHLLLGHHREDQAETLLLRRERGSGVYGLAGMPEIRETGAMRILRPLLSLPKARLRATVNALGVDVVEDPSNDNLRFSRVRIRQGLKDKNHDPSVARLSNEATRKGVSRATFESAVAKALARTCVVFTEGYCLLNWRGLITAPLDVRCRVLACVVTCVGGQPYAPRYKRLRNLQDVLAAENLGGGRTLSGCRILPRKSKLLVCREPAAISDVAEAQGSVHWDGRFRLRMLGESGGAVIGKLGDVRLASLGLDVKREPVASIPPAVRPSLPAIWRDDTLLLAPHIGYKNLEFGNSDLRIAQIAFAPRNPLTTARFTLA
ncbi:MAG: tRNA lysidine(34) synthetase TilS [Rhodospirillaceae bacterium]|nr:tRNA lysidine(34) synthetase TilS [Rhodospirillaceae bacterium]MBT5666063.1 tRNA lysidine(34) synthetase TilS [Rhodospirillaceae bacterium]